MGKSRGRRSPSRLFRYSIDFSPSRNELHDKLIGIRLGFAFCRKAEHRRVAQALSFEYVPSIPTRTIWVRSDPNGVGLDFWHSRTMRHPRSHFHPKANQGLAARERRGVASAMSELAFSSRALCSLDLAASLVKATNLLAVVSLSVDLKNRADEEFRRELFDCETNSVRRPRKPPISESLIHGFAAPRREQLRRAAIEISHEALGPASSGDCPRPRSCGLGARFVAQRAAWRRRSQPVPWPGSCRKPNQRVGLSFKYFPTYISDNRRHGHHSSGINYLISNGDKTSRTGSSFFNVGVKNHD